MTYQRSSKRGRTVARITNPEVLAAVDRVREEIRSLLGCSRIPGIQVVMDALIKWWESEEHGRREDFIRNIWTTPVLGYPNSSRQNPGEFASKRELAAAEERIRRSRDG